MKAAKMVSGGDDQYWWATLDILAGRQEKKPAKDIMADVDDWLAKLTAKIAKQRKVALQTPKAPTPPRDKEEETAVVVASAPQQHSAAAPVSSKKMRLDQKKSEPLPQFQYLQTSFGDHIEIQFRFSNPRIRSRLEKLMGSNVVRITDRKYMIKLQERIKEDHLENQRKRIQEREAEEVEREKKLILEGKIPIEAAPKELQNHPVCKINQITKKILEDKKVKGKPQSRATSSKGSGKKSKESPEKNENQDSRDEASEELTSKAEVDDNDSSEAKVIVEVEEVVVDTHQEVLLKKDEVEKLKYEAPLVKALKKVENVDEMYKLAEEIVGPLKHQKTSKRRLRRDPGAGPGPN